MPPRTKKGSVKVSHKDQILALKICPSCTRDLVIKGLGGPMRLQCVYCGEFWDLEMPTSSGK